MHRRTNPKAADLFWNKKILKPQKHLKGSCSKEKKKIKTSSLLNVSSDAGSKPEEFSINDIGVNVDKKEQNWFKRAFRVSSHPQVNDKAARRRSEI